MSSSTGRVPSCLSPRPQSVVDDLPEGFPPLGLDPPEECGHVVISRERAVLTIEIR